jgi:hypothetical protein
MTDKPTPKTKTKTKKTNQRKSLSKPSELTYNSAKVIKNRKKNNDRNILTQQARERFSQPWQMLLLQSFDQLAQNQAKGLAIALFAEVFNCTVSNDTQRSDHTDKNHLSLDIQAIIAGYKAQQSIVGLKKKNHVKAILDLFHESFSRLRDRLNELENQVKIQGLDGRSEMIPAPDTIIEKEEIILTYANIIRSGVNSAKEKMDAAKGLRDLFGWDAKTTGRDNKNPLIAILQLVDGTTKDLSSANILPESSPLLKSPPSERGVNFIEAECVSEVNTEENEEDLFEL